jgi:hypothetical protein
VSFEQGGADFICKGRKTKKALKDAIKEGPSKVYLSSTSAVVRGWSGYASDLPEDMSFNVVGPDPFQDRSWFATVTRNGDKVTVK